MFVEYTAARNLSSGHSASTSYYINFRASNFQTRYNGVRNQQVALSGSREVIGLRVENIYSVTATMIDGDDLDLWKEFLSSVAYGESFTLDIGFTATYASQVNPLTVKLLSESWNEVMLDHTGDYYEISFEVIES